MLLQKNEDIIFIECKRIKSSKALEENFRETGKQLMEIIFNEHYGLIFIDIYNCISDKIRDYEYSSVVAMDI